MNKPDIIIDLFKYFSRYVRKEVLQKMFVSPEGMQMPGYAEMEAEIMNYPDDKVIPDIDMYVFSGKEEFVKQQLKNTEGICLFVEYGHFTYNPTVTEGIREELAIHIAHPYSLTTNDNLGEALIMNRTNNILCSILEQMEEDQNDLEFCCNRKLIVFPAEIVAIDPKAFYDRTGWMGIFENTNS